jgi:hypothetical protein
MAKAEFVLLAHEFEPKRHAIGGWMLSEKLDGFRAIWDGGVSRGLPKSMVPWANNAKDARYVEPPVATGLWTRYGNVYHAPNWFLDMLPPYPLDGELTLGRGQWQATSSIVKQIVPGHEWRRITYKVIDSPRWEQLLADRTLSSPNFKKRIVGALDWAKAQMQLYVQPTSTIEFDRMYNWLQKVLEQSDNVQVHQQTKLPMHTSGAAMIVEDELNMALEQGGEGVILRNFVSLWRPERSHDLLKHKPWKDAEGTVTGYTWGRRTDLGSKLLGKMGALVLNFQGKRLELSGFTDAEREMTFHPRPDRQVITADMLEGELFAGRDVSDYWYNKSFPIGSTVTFRYRELSDGGIPKEARYWRKHHVVA